MLYPLVRPFAAIALKVFFQKIHLSNTDRIPRDKPVIIAANHPTAFVEPCILACYLDRPLYFLARGDLFKKKFYARLLNMLHILPVYRMKDRGYKYVRKNYSTFDACYDALNERKTIMILAEGYTIHEKRLRPLQKGTARLALGALEKYPDDMDDVYIVPAGVNYTYADRFRSEVMIDFGEPISARDYWAEYQENQMGAITSLTDVLSERLKAHIIIIEEESDDALVENLFILHRSEATERPFPILDFSRDPLTSEMAIADAVNNMDVVEKNILAEKTDRYFELLEAHQLKDETLVRNNKFTLFNSLILLLGFVLFLPGYLLNYPPLRLARYISDTRVRHIEFYSSVMVAAALILYLIWFILLFLLVLNTGRPAGFLLLAIIPLLGIVALWWMELAAKWIQGRRLKKLDGDTINRLGRERQEILRQFGLQLAKTGRVF